MNQGFMKFKIRLMCTQPLGTNEIFDKIVTPSSLKLTLIALITVLFFSLIAKFLFLCSNSNVICK